MQEKASRVPNFFVMIYVSEITCTVMISLDPRFPILDDWGMKS